MFSGQALIFDNFVYFIEIVVDPVFDKSTVKEVRNIIRSSKCVNDFLHNHFGLFDYIYKSYMLSS